MALCLYLQTVVLLSLALRCWAEGYGSYGGHGGKCSNDGFYYNDDNSIMMCSNGNSYLMYCAPGTENDGGRHYSKSYSDFCNVNLNDYGYGASKYGSEHSFSSSSGSGYGHASSGHGSSGYHMPKPKPKPKPSYGGYGPLIPRQYYPAAHPPVYMNKY